MGSLEWLASSRWAVELGAVVLLKATVVLVLAGAISALARRRSAAVRCAVWTTSSLALVLLPVLSFVTPDWEIGILHHPAGSGVVERAPWRSASPGTDRLSFGDRAWERTEGAMPGAAGIPSGPDVRQTGGATAGLPSGPRGRDAADSAAGPVVAGGAWPEPASSGSPASDSPAAPVSWGPVLLVGWLLGAGLLALRFAVDAVRVVHLTRTGSTAGRDSELTRRLQALRRRLGIRRSVRIVISDRLAVPVTWGVWHPAILLPASADRWSDEQLRAVLLHELAHIRRWDYPMHLLGEGVRVLYWPNPLAWWAVGRVRTERERACDDEVLRQGHAGPAYARFLVDLARAFSRDDRVAGGAMAMARPSMLKTRVNGVLDRGSDRRPASGAAVVAVAGLLLLATVPLASLRLYGAPPAGGTTAELVRALSHEVCEVRSEAAGILGERRAVEAAPALADLLDDPVPDVRRAALVALGRIADPSSVSDLAAVAADPQAERSERLLAATALGRIRGPGTARALGPLLHAQDPELRIAAARGLGRLHGEAAQAASALRGALDDPDPAVRAQALVAYASVWCMESVPALRAALGDTDAGVRAAAVEELARVGGRGVRSSLECMLEDEAGQVRVAAARALRSLDVGRG